MPHSRMRFGVVGLIMTAAAAGQLIAATIFFGPKTYTLATGSPVTISETISYDTSQTCDGKTAFVLVIQNGGTGTTGPVSSANVTVNGTTVAKESDFNGKQARIERPIILLIGANALGVQLKGGNPGNGLTLSVRKEIEEAIRPASVFLLGGGQQTFSQSFTVADPTSPFVLTLQNGDASGLHAVNSGSVRVNGIEVIAEKDLTSNARLLRKNVVLQTTNTLTADLKGQAGDSVTLAIKRVLDESACGPHVFFSTPAAGSVIGTSLILVTGTTTGTSDVGVTVNGFPASIDVAAAGTLAAPFRWIAQVEADRGPLTLHAIATTASGSRGEASRDVSVSPVSNDLIVRASPPSGLVPLLVTLNVTSPAPESVSRYEADLDGDGTYEIAGPTLPDPLTATFSTPGVHVITVRATDVNGRITTTASAAVVAQTFALMDSLLKATWSRFVAALGSGNVDTALAQLVDDATRDKYRAALVLIQPTVKSFAAAIQNIQPMWISANAAHYLLTRLEAGELVGYHVYFARDENGVWRIVQF